MKLIKTPAEWNPLWLNHLQNNLQIGLVPTMGALHQGHLDLVAKSIAETDCTVVSIFVNPTQFNNPEDFKKYPNTLEADLEKLDRAGANYVFVPEASTIYPSTPKLTFDFGDLERVLEGEFRPGHFNGVGIVVSKLFHILRPDKAFFGQKDLQQVAIIKRLTQDLSFPLELEIVPTRRELDGLAMSSRNLRLDPDERIQALILINSLNYAKNELLAGKNWLDIQKKVQEDYLQNKQAKLDYFELIHPDTFDFYQEFDSSKKSSICVAAYIGEIRLIDNLPIIP